MEKFKSLLQKIPTTTLAFIALWLAIVPFNPPHLVEKIQMLFAGTLSKPIDIFDLFMHGTPLVLLVLKLTWAREKPEPQG